MVQTGFPIFGGDTVGFQEGFKNSLFIQSAEDRRKTLYNFLQDERLGFVSVVESIVDVEEYCFYLCRHMLL